MEYLCGNGINNWTRIYLGDAVYNRIIYIQYIISNSNPFLHGQIDLFRNS